MISSQFTSFLPINASRQTFLELPPSAGEPRHDRSRRNLRDVRYLLVREIFFVSQRQDLTEFRRQFIHCFPNEFRVFTTLQNRRGTHRLVVGRVSFLVKWRG